MAIIDTYPINLTVALTDILIGSDGTNRTTKNFIVSDLLDLKGEGTPKQILMWSPTGTELVDSPLRVATTGGGHNQVILDNTDRFIIDKLSTSTAGDPEYLITQDGNYKFSMGWDDDGGGFGYLYNWSGAGIKLGSAGNNPVLEILTSGIPKVEVSGGLSVSEITEYTDNTAAIAAGLTTGAFYRTGDLLKIVH